MSKTTISDPRIRLIPTMSLLELIDQHKESIVEIPVNVANALKHNGYDISAKVELLDTESIIKPLNIDTKLLNNLCSDSEKDQKTPEDDAKNQKTHQSDVPKQNDSKAVYLHLNDLRWLNEFLAALRKNQGLDIYLHSVIETCSLELPENDIIERDPKLEARCQKLREEQQNREYRKMTKNVDAVLKNYPEDTIAYQMKAINSQIIAVLQFVFSVVAGFVFGFLGIELIIGNLDFGLRLLLGIMFALIIALAEIYFLAKKLNEFDSPEETMDTAGTPYKNKKVHTD